jgi:hypothetical protein
MEAIMAQLSKGQVSVIVVLNKQPALIESALAVREGRRPRIDIREVVLPHGFVIDPTFPAVPLGREQPGVFAPDSFLPQRSEIFAVRAFFETDDPAKIPHQVGDARIFSDPIVEPFLTCGGDPAVGNIGDVRAKLDTSLLWRHGLDGTGVAVAIVDKGINLAYLTTKLGTQPRLDVAKSWAPAGAPAAPGQYPISHGTACAYDALIAAPNLTLLDYPYLAQPQGQTLGSSLAVAFQAYSQLLSDWLFRKFPADLVSNYVRRGLGDHAALVVNNSWGVLNQNVDLPQGSPGRYIDNPYHPFQLIVSALALAGADIAFAAGDCGVECPNPQCGGTTGSIMGANASAAVLSLAGCDTNDVRVGYSSQGPSIANMPPQKPDVTAYTHFRGSEVRGTGIPDGGTSAACAVATGCIAAVRTRASPSNISPAALFDLLRKTGRQVAGPHGWNKDYGHGIINPVLAARTIGLIP